jgi:hypothetical protein
MIAKSKQTYVDKVYQGIWRRQHKSVLTGEGWLEKRKIAADGYTYPKGGSPPFC